MQHVLIQEVTNEQSSIICYQVSCAQMWPFFTLWEPRIFETSKNLKVIWTVSSRVYSMYHATNLSSYH